jgi:hypothetical protein
VNSQTTANWVELQRGFFGSGTAVNEAVTETVQTA